MQINSVQFGTQIPKTKKKNTKQKALSFKLHTEPCHIRIHIAQYGHSFHI